MNQRTDMTVCSALLSMLYSVLSAAAWNWIWNCVLGWFHAVFLSSFPGRVRSSEVPGSSGLGLGTKKQ